MTPRSRVLLFGSAAVLVVAGAICAVVLDGLTGRILSSGLITVGAGGAFLLLFLEVGLSEDRDLEREEALRRKRREGSGRPRRRRQSILRPRRRP
jgi:hypothetical protein